jgi:hypothetical protein
VGPVPKEGFFFIAGFAVFGILTWNLKVLAIGTVFTIKLLLEGGGWIVDGWGRYAIDSAVAPMID